MNIPRASLALLFAAATFPAAAAFASPSDSGQSLYSQHCAMCHGTDGKGGIPGAPDFTKPGGVLTQSDAVLVQRILNGYRSPGAQMAMPAMKGQLNAAQVEEILDYMHKAFGVEPPEHRPGG